MRKIAKERGWTTHSYYPVGKCRGCHKYIFYYGFTTNIWISPRGTYYHEECAIKRIKKEKGKRSNGHKKKA